MLLVLPLLYLTRMLLYSGNGSIRSLVDIAYGTPRLLLISLRITTLDSPLSGELSVNHLCFCGIFYWIFGLCACCLFLLCCSYYGMYSSPNTPCVEPTLPTEERRVPTSFRKAQRRFILGVFVLRLTLVNEAN